MSFSDGFVAGAQVGNSLINTYKHAKLQAGLARAGDFTPTEVASGEDAHTAGLRARQFQLDQISADDPDFAAKYKQVQDDYAPTIAGLEANRARGTSNMVQLPGGRRIEQDEAFSPEQMAGLRAEQASRVYAQQGYPEEAAKATMVAQGITKNRLGMQKDELDLKAARRKDKQETAWTKQDDMYQSLMDPDLPLAEKEKNVESLAKLVGPMITADDDRFKGIKYKGVENSKKDGMHILVETPDGEGKVPLTMEMIHQGYNILAQSRDPAKYAEFMQRRLQAGQEEAGRNSRQAATNATQIQIGRENNASAEKVARIRVDGLMDRGGSSGVPGLTPELAKARLEEMKAIESNPNLTPVQKDDLMSRVQMKYNPKMGQLKEPNQKVGLSVQDLGKIHEMVDIPQRGDKDNPAAAVARKRDAANRIHPGAGDQLYGPAPGGAAAGISGGGQKVRYDAQGNAWVLGPNGIPVPAQ